MVQAIDDSARQFYEHFKFDPSPVDAFQLMLLLKISGERYDSGRRAGHSPRLR